LRIKDFNEAAPGKLIQAPEGHLSFLPSPLPPGISYSSDLVERLSAADRALGELAGVGRMLPNPHLLIRPFVRREAVLSSKIEGTVTRLDQLLLFEAQADRDPAQAADTVEVANYVTALEYGLERVRNGMPLCLRLIREIHERLMHDVRGGEKQPGKFRTCPAYLGRVRRVGFPTRPFRRTRKSALQG
jgi:Fic family protein